MYAYLVVYSDYDDVRIDSVWTSRVDAELRLEEIKSEAGPYEVDWDIDEIPFNRAGFR